MKENNSPLNQNLLFKPNYAQNTQFVIRYAVHMHPLTLIQTPDLLEKDKDAMFDITCQILYTALPLYLCFLLNSGSLLINVYMIGNHQSTLDFAAVCFGTILTNVVLYYIIENIGLGFNFVCSYFEEKQEVGYMYQKTLGINFFVCILITPILYLSDKFFIALGFNQALVHLAGDYVWALVPSFYLYAFFQTTTNYLQSQGVIYPPIVITLIGVIAHILISYLFVFVFEFGLVGSAWAKNLTDSISSLILYLFVVYKQPTKQSWIQWDIKATNNIHRFLMQVMGHQILTFLQVLAFQIMCIIACNLPSLSQISAHYTFSFTYLIIYFGFVSISHCINKELSVSIEDNRNINGFDMGIKGARKKVSLGFFITLIFCLIVIMNLHFYKKKFFHFFHDDIKELEILNSNLIFFQLAILLSGLQVVLLGIIKTLQIKILWKISLISFYVVGLGSSCILGYVFNYGLQGIWIGWSIGQLVSLMFLIRYIYQIDWQKTIFIVRDKFKTIQEDIRQSKIQLIQQPYMSNKQIQ